MEEEKIIRPKFKWHGEPREDEVKEFNSEELKAFLRQAPLSPEARDSLCAEVDEVARLYVPVKADAGKYRFLKLLVILGAIGFVGASFFLFVDDFVAFSFLTIFSLVLFLLSILTLHVMGLRREWLLQADSVFLRHYAREMEKLLNGE